MKILTTAWYINIMMGLYDLRPGSSAGLYLELLLTKPRIHERGGRAAHTNNNGKFISNCSLTSRCGGTQSPRRLYSLVGQVAPPLQERVCCVAGVDAVSSEIPAGET